MKNIAYYNGAIGTINEISIPANDRAVYFCDGVYDIAIAKNFRIFALNDHINRFFCGMKQLQIPFTMTKLELSKLITSLLEKLDAPGNAIIYWQASRGTPRTCIPGI